MLECNKIWGWTFLIVVGVSCMSEKSVDISVADWKANTWQFIEDHCEGVSNFETILLGEETIKAKIDGRVFTSVATYIDTLLKNRRLVSDYFGENLQNHSGLKVLEYYQGSNANFSIEVDGEQGITLFTRNGIIEKAEQETDNNQVAFSDLEAGEYPCFCDFSSLPNWVSIQSTIDLKSGSVEIEYVGFSN